MVNDRSLDSAPDPIANGQHLFHGQPFALLLTNARELLSQGPVTTLVMVSPVSSANCRASL
jgi:hypothetical protein